MSLSPLVFVHWSQLKYKYQFTHKRNTATHKICKEPCLTPHNTSQLLLSKKKKIQFSMRSAQRNDRVVESNHRARNLATWNSMEFFFTWKRPDYVFTSLSDCICRNRVSFCEAQPDDFHSLKITFCLINVTSLKHLYNFFLLEKCQQQNHVRCHEQQVHPPAMATPAPETIIQLKTKAELCALLEYQLSVHHWSPQSSTPLPAAAH